MVQGLDYYTAREFSPMIWGRRRFGGGHYDGLVTEELGDTMAVWAGTWWSRALNITAATRCNLLPVEY